MLLFTYCTHAHTCTIYCAATLLHPYDKCIYILQSFSVHFECAGGARVRDDLVSERLLVAAKVADPIASRGGCGRDVPLNGGLALTQYVLYKSLVDPVKPAEIGTHTHTVHA